MDDAQGTYNYEYEGIIFGMGMDVVVTESNGHGEDEKEESMNLVETIKVFKMKSKVINLITIIL